MTSLSVSDLSVPAPPPGPADWNADGVVILRRLIPDDLIAAYMAEWCEANAGPDMGFSVRHRADGVEDGDGILALNAAQPGGWPDCTPYMRHPALRAICTHPLLARALEALLGEPAGVHLNLTGWVSTERDWHQDGYLNPPEVGDYYAAVWIALGSIHPDAGPFQYIPGSHRWHRLVREKFAPYLDLDDPQWPKHSEQILSPMIERLIEDGSRPSDTPVEPLERVLDPSRRPATVETYLPSKGDVLIWHPRLYHRGSKANVPGAYRPALIAHYSGIDHRPDMPPAARERGSEDGWYFPLGGTQPVR